MPTIHFEKIDDEKIAVSSQEPFTLGRDPDGMWYIELQNGTLIYIQRGFNPRWRTHNPRGKAIPYTEMTFWNVAKE